MTRNGPVGSGGGLSRVLPPGAGRLAVDRRTPCCHCVHLIDEMPVLFGLFVGGFNDCLGPVDGRCMPNSIRARNRLL
jgi:hypothetical protein